LELKTKDMKRCDPDRMGKVPNIEGVKMLTTTTGYVYGVDNVKRFISECKTTFSNVDIVDTTNKIEGYVQYTLLTNNRIRIYD
jgi:hypothetical protein